MRRGIALAPVVLLGACAQLPLSNPATTVVLSPSWLIGGWVPQGESCESDAGVRYDADGTWIAYEAAGIWRLEGSSIVSVVTEKWADGLELPVPAPERHVERIETLGPDTYRSSRADGTVVTLRRCASLRS
jgi:hypothetical protein